MPRNERQVRVVVGALIEHGDQLLLAQLATGRFAGFWLLPSASLEAGTLEETARHMIAERTGFPVLDCHLRSVVQETKFNVQILRFIFSAIVGEREIGSHDPEISQVRWFSRDAVREVLEERDVVPNLGVMSTIRAWLDHTEFQPLEVLTDDALCPCGSGFRFRGCCGWDAD